MFRTQLAASLSVVLLTGSLIWGSNLRGPEFLAGVEEGFGHIYNLDYEQANASFQRLRTRFPQHPAPPLYLATAIWLRELFQRQEFNLQQFVSPGYFDKPSSRQMPAADRRRFEELMAESKQLAEKLVEQDPSDKDVRYFIGSLHGIRGSFAMTIDRSKTQAFRHGRQAYKMHLALVEEDPQFHDAYMSVGLYEYIAGNLPWYIKWLAAIIGYRGNKGRGFEYLGRASENGIFVADDARLLQMFLYVREGMYVEALANIEKLKERATKNFILRLNEAQVLERMGRPNQAAETYLEVLDLANRGVPNFHLLPLPTMRLQLGKKLFELNQLEPALEHLRQAATEDSLPLNGRLEAQLASGQILDLLGRRAEAQECYRAVLEKTDRGVVYKRARRFLKKPYTGGRRVKRS